MPSDAWGEHVPRRVNGVNFNINVGLEQDGADRSVYEEDLHPSLLEMQHADVFCVLGDHMELLQEYFAPWNHSFFAGLVSVEANQHILGSNASLKGYMPDSEYVPVDGMPMPANDYKMPFFVLTFEDLSNVHTDFNQPPHSDREFWRLVKLFREQREKNWSPAAPKLR